MRKQFHLVTLPICAAIIVAGAWLANAGDLNPPVGPVEATMHTLDEIYDAVSNNGSDCEPCEWQVITVDIQGSEFQEILPTGTSGVVRSIVLSTNTPAYGATASIRAYSAS